MLVIVIALLVVKIVRDSQIKNVDTATTEETAADASTDAAILLTRLTTRWIPPATARAPRSRSTA